ncbi:peptidylprolyl isomerase [Micromonospora sp. CPCC 206060]|uniref:peptidylprolyl isomerase n=1 Tax=Micromonospora sp. CPCC 206060 TaxID=3122406 RepID=UPI002FF0EF7A
MTSTKERQRAAARARLEKEMAERAARARKRRQTQAAVAAGAALLLVIAGTVWLVSSLGDDDKSTDTAASNGGSVLCAWNEVPAEARTKQVKDVGLPAVQAKNSGTQVMTIDTSLGPITAKVNLTQTPCTAASFTHLASKKFFDNTKCHRLTTGQLKVLQCGDPSATGKGYRDTDGTGGPTYRFAEENLPTDKRPAYPEGVIAMAKTQEPASTGSQFFIVYGDAQLDPSYTVLGTITSGMDLVKKVGAAGSDNANQEGDGHPKTEVLIKSLTMSEIQG